MSAIQTIVDTYIRFADEKALLALKAHRLKLLATIDADDPFFRNLRNQCVEEISAIEAGLEQLRPPPPVPLHVPTPMPTRAPVFMPAPEPEAALEAEPEPEVQLELHAEPEPEIQLEPEPEPQAELMAPVIDVPEAESAEAETVASAAEQRVDAAKADDIPVSAHMAALALDFAAPAAEPPASPEPQIAQRPRVDASLVASALLTASLAGSRPTGPNAAADLINLQQRIATRPKP